MTRRFNKILGDLFGGFSAQDLFQSFSERLDQALAAFRPVFLRRDNGFLSPVILILAVLWAIVTTGVAIGSFFTLFLSLLILYFIVTRVFGIHLNLDDVVVV